MQSARGRSGAGRRARPTVIGWPSRRRYGRRRRRTRDESDDLGRFIADACHVISEPAAREGSQHKSTTTRLLEAYDARAKREGGDSFGSVKEFAKALDTKGFPAGKRRSDGRWRYDIAPIPNG